MTPPIGLLSLLAVSVLKLCVELLLQNIQNIVERRISVLNTATRLSDVWPYGIVYHVPCLGNLYYCTAPVRRSTGWCHGFCCTRAFMLRSRGLLLCVFDARIISWHMRYRGTAVVVVHVC